MLTLLDSPLRFYEGPVVLLSDWPLTLGLSVPGLKFNSLFWSLYFNTFVYYKTYNMDPDNISQETFLSLILNKM